MKILLIGNSHTYYNDMGAMLAALTGGEVTLQTTGGADLLFHRQQTDVRFNILYGGYDWVVLQNRQQAIPPMTEHMEGLEGLMSWLGQVPSKVLGYAVWSIPGAEDTTDAQAALWEAARERFGFDYAPVGEAFRQATDSGINLYASDNRHASPAGSYLIALCLYKGITGNAVTGLPGVLSYAGHPLVSLTSEETAALQHACETAYEVKNG